MKHSNYTQQGYTNDASHANLLLAAAQVGKIIRYVPLYPRVVFKTQAAITLLEAGSSLVGFIWLSVRSVPFAGSAYRLQLVFGVQQLSVSELLCKSLNVRLLIMTNVGSDNNKLV